MSLLHDFLVHCDKHGFNPSSRVRNFIMADVQSSPDDKKIIQGVFDRLYDFLHTK